MIGFKSQVKKVNWGFSLVEVILAIALFGLFATALIGLLVTSYQSDVQAADRERAVLYAQQGFEAAQSIKRQAWNFFQNGDYGLDASSGHWQFAGMSDVLDGVYTRVVNIADVCRDASQTIVDCSTPGAVLDLYTKAVRTEVGYTAVTGVSNQVALFGYLSTWQSRDWVQTDWSGGSGQALWTNLAAYDTDDGNLAVTPAGQVSLKEQASVGCGTRIWTFDTPSNYTFDPIKIEVTGGLAQLVDASGCLGTATTCDSFSDQTSCQNQTGCSWSGGVGSCENIGSCSAEPRQSCVPACGGAGCSRSGPNCIGSLNCSNFIDQASCEGCGQCAWSIGGSCDGTATSCSTFADQTSCQDQSGCSWSSGFPTDNPSINPLLSFEVESLDHWSGFTEIANKNGGEIFYQLSDDDGANWYFWDGAGWSLAGAGDYTTAAEIDLHIASFSISSKKILFKAFLSSDGSQQVQLDQVEITCSQGNEWPFTDPANYSFDPTKIEVSGGVAQLVDQSSSSQCSGTPATCDSFSDQTSCQNQTGCSWSGGVGSCENIGSCSAEPRQSCVPACGGAGCSRSGPNCIGSLNCSNFIDQASCEGCGQCAWTAGSGSCSGAPDPCSIFSDNASCQAQSGCVWSGGGISFPTDNPAITPLASVVALSIDRWTGFTEIANKNGGEIFYQLSDDDGANWYFWDGAGWSLAGGSDYTTAGLINNSIESFPTSSAKILIRAFLSSDGTQQVQLDNVAVSWSEAGGGAASGYATFGTLTSSAFDADNSASVNIIEWDEDVTLCGPTCQITFQVRSAPDAGGVPGTWTDWYGASGSGTYFINASGTLAPTDLNFNQWLQYRVELTGDGASTPALHEVRLNYTP